MGEQRAKEVAQEGKTHRFLREAGLEAPDLRSDVINLLRGIDPTMGFLGNMLPDPAREDPILQLLAGSFIPGGPAAKGVGKIAGKGDDLADLIRGLVGSPDLPPGSIAPTEWPNPAAAARELRALHGGAQSKTFHGIPISEFFRLSGK